MKTLIKNKNKRKKYFKNKFKIIKNNYKMIVKFMKPN